MEAKPLRAEIASLCESLSKGGLRTVPELLFSVAGDRSLEDHDKWDKQRDRAQNSAIESIAANIHSTPRKERDIEVDVLKQVDELPPIDLGSKHSAEPAEVAALKAAGSLQQDGRRLTAADPVRFLGGLVALAADKEVWYAFSRQQGLTDLYSSVVEPISSNLQAVASYETFLRIACHVSRIYGVRVRTVPAEEIYRSAPAFVKNAGNGAAMTLATSSGVLDPMERVGTEDLLCKLDIPRDSDVAHKFKKKDAWRVINFRDGLLNRRFENRRLYFFDRQTTAEAMRAVLSVIPDDEKRSKYKDMAAENLIEALKCPGFELYEVPNFENWMWRYTRSSPGHALICMRHPETKAITEGIQLTFKDPKRRHTWFQRIFSSIGIGVGAGCHPLGLAVFTSSLLGEELLYDQIDTHLLRSQAEEDMLRCSNRITIAASTDSGELKAARCYIDSLIGK